MQVAPPSWFFELSPFLAAAAEAGAAVVGPEFGLFDVLIIIMAGLGCWRGKVQGISEELLECLQWVAIVVAGGLLYGFVGDLIIKASLSRLWANILGYGLVATVVVTIFSYISKLVGNKLVDTDFFGNWEYRLGMVAGAIRWLCVGYVFGSRCWPNCMRGILIRRWSRPSARRRWRTPAWCWCRVGGF